MEKFIYVFDEDSAEKLVTLGYRCLVSIKSGGVYVFTTQRENLTFSEEDLDGVVYVLSDTLPFAL